MKINKYKKFFFNNCPSVIKTESVGSVSLGLFGLKVVGPGTISAVQLEAARRIISRITKRSSKILIRIFFYYAKTKKSLLTRMGSGVGSFFSFLLVI